MSDCNYCKFNQMKKRAKKENKILVKKSSSFSLGGIEVHELKNKNEKVTEKNNIAWFLVLPSSCEC